MLTFSELRERFAQPFDDVKFRAGNTRNTRGGGKECKPLAYISAEHVIELLNEACPEDWTDHYTPHPTRPGCWVCVLTICGIPREGVGQGGGDDAEPEKSAESDALKRAACKFGIGLYLRKWDLPYTPMEQVGDKWFLPFGYAPPDHIPIKGQRRPRRQNNITAPTPPAADEASIEKPRAPEKPATANQVKKIKEELEKRVIKPNRISEYLERCGATKIEELPLSRASKLIDEIMKLPLKQQGA